VKTRYLFSSTDGPVPVPEDFLQGPFLLSPTQEHPTLRLNDYFDAIGRFLLEAPPSPILTALGRKAGTPVLPGAIEEIRIISEKHGALYHVARIEVIVQDEKVNFALLSALPGRGADSLRHEREALRRLWAAFSFRYVPEVFASGEVPVGRGDPPLRLGMILEEWFQDYHEWHFSFRKTGEPVLLLWDPDRGHRPLGKESMEKIFKQAAKILTLYYDIETGSRILSWHHAAGDFVVREKNGAVDVKLTTVRDYDIPESFKGREENPPGIPLLFFFLELCLKMRIDRLEGTGERHFAGREILKPVLEGFFEALEVKNGEGRFPLGEPADFRWLLRSFSKEEMGHLLDTLVEILPPDDPEDLPLIRHHQEAHLEDLLQVIHSTP